MGILKAFPGLRRVAQKNWPYTSSDRGSKGPRFFYVVVKTTTISADEMNILIARARSLANLDQEVPCPVMREDIRNAPKLRRFKRSSAMFLPVCEERIP